MNSSTQGDVVEVFCRVIRKKKSAVTMGGSVFDARSASSDKRNPSNEFPSLEVRKVRILRRVVRVGR